MNRSLLPLLIVLLLGALSPAQPIDGAPKQGEYTQSLSTRFHQAHAALEKLVLETAKNDLTLAAELRQLLTQLESMSERLGVPPQAEGPQILIKMRLIEFTRVRFDKIMGKVMPPKGASPKSGDALMLNAEMAKLLTTEPNALTAPSLLTLAGQRASIFVGGGTSALYFERRRDGSYEMKHHRTDDGISINVMSTPSDDGRSLRCFIEGSVKKTLGKTPIKEDADTIGLPIMTERSFSTNFTSLDGGSVCIPLFDQPREKGLNLIVLITTEILNSDLPKRK